MASIKKDVNITILTGKVVSEPFLLALKSNQDMLKFDLESIETFKLKNQTKACHVNTFPVEVIGRNALKYKEELSKGMTVMISGYLRQDMINGDSKLRVRCLHLEIE